MAEPSAFARLLASRWFDAGLALVLTTASLAELFARPDLTHSPRAAVVVVIVGASLVVRRTHPVAAAFVAATTVVATPDFDEAFLPDLSFAFPSILAYSCGAHAPRGQGLIGVGVLAAGLQIGAGFEEFPNFEIYFGTFAPWWIGFQVRRRRQLVAELAERTAQLEAEQDAFTRLAVRRERARIARELHDIVAHHLAVIVIQAGAGRLAPPGQTDGAAERFTTIRESGGEALVEMARLVDILEVDTRAGATGLGKLSVLLDEAAAGGVRVGFIPLQSEVRLPADVEDYAYRVVREGLTNAIKHAPGAEVTVRLAVSDDVLEVEVSDTGAGASSVLATTGSGLGLTGLRERVESLRGSVEAGPRDGGGWTLRARLPVCAPQVIPCAVAAARVTPQG
jgi:signal transduction histidine kinase